MTKSKLLMKDQQAGVSVTQPQALLKPLNYCSLLLLAGLGFTGATHAASMTAPTASAGAKMVLNSVGIDGSSNLAATLIAQDTSTLHAGQVFLLGSTGTATGSQDAQFTSVNGQVLVPALIDSDKVYKATLALVSGSNPLKFEVTSLVLSSSGGIQAPQTVYFNGEKGATGDAGAKGATGDKGATGNFGATGATGPKGETGDAGAKGATGDAGAAGATGAEGARGAVGPKGDAGDASTVSGPAGEAGVNGTPGPVGVNGTNGVDGATGATGATGANGATGATGATGADGVLTPLAGNAVGDIRYLDDGIWKFLAIGATGASLTTCFNSTDNETYPTWNLYPVGSTGPNGGIVIYNACDGTGTEVSKNDLANPSNAGGTTSWAGGCGQSITTSTASGTGTTNTVAIKSVCVTPNIAADLAQQQGAGWYLPSKDELNIFMALALPRTNCAAGATFADPFNVCGNVNGFYWSSSQADVAASWAQTVNASITQVGLSRSGNQAKVRAFHNF